jgi:hypothetical protein
VRNLALVAALAIPATAFAGGWNTTRGDGQKVTEPRPAAAFTSVRLVGALDATVTVGGPQAVAVTIDRNLQPLVTTEVRGSTLVVRCEKASWEGKGLVEISIPSLRGFAIDGSGDATIEGGQGDLSLSIDGSGDLRWKGAATKLDAAISGSGDMVLSGTAERAHLAVAGSGDVRAGSLTARSAEVSVAGSGDVEVTLAGGALSASVAGSGDVIWHGQAVLEQAAVAGSGSIVRR